jgi:hypothetical protein
MKNMFKYSAGISVITEIVILVGKYQPKTNMFCDCLAWTKKWSVSVTRSCFIELLLYNSSQSLFVYRLVLGNHVLNSFINHNFQLGNLQSWSKPSATLYIPLRPFFLLGQNNLPVCLPSPLKTMLDILQLL